MLSKARKIMVSPIEKSELFKATKIEFQNQSKGRKAKVYTTFGCCFFWILNSALGLYILSVYPELHESHP